jgi:hypothetical protein
LIPGSGNIFFSEASRSAHGLAQRHIHEHEGFFPLGVKRSGVQSLSLFYMQCRAQKCVKQYFCSTASTWHAQKLLIVTPCVLKQIYCSFGGTNYLLFFSVLKTERLYFPEKLVNFCHSTRRRIPEDCCRHLYRGESVISNT